MVERVRTLAAISDFREGWPPQPARDRGDYRRFWKDDRTAARLHDRLNAIDLAAARRQTCVGGGYMERLSLACIRAGIVDYAEKWHYTRDHQPGIGGLEQPLFGWRAFHLPDHEPERAPFESPDMLATIEANGAPDVLCVWGLGVSERVMQACADSFRIYYSIDALPLRLPPEVSRHFDLILVGGEWQAEAVRAVHPDMRTAILTIGPEFADPDTFRPLPDVEKDYDLVYVACAQPYKRHDILFEAMARARRRLRALCVIGYGHTRQELEAMARDLNIEVDFIGPPGLDYAGVNAQINRARIGVVAGQRDGCPSILSEYRLAGVPVLANAALCCGLRFVTPRAGVIAPPGEWHTAIVDMLDRLDEFDPRAAALEDSTWERSIETLRAAMES